MLGSEVLLDQSYLVFGRNAHPGVNDRMHQTMDKRVNLRAIQPALHTNGNTTALRGGLAGKCLPDWSGSEPSHPDPL